eukprot:XP_011660957.1 PREDICTED: uncharacterized protein LOC105436753 [Strongylocentrotus purpuratus]
MVQWNLGHTEAVLKTWCGPPQPKAETPASTEFTRLPPAGRSRQVSYTPGPLTRKTHSHYITSQLRKIAQETNTPSERTIKENITPTESPIKGNNSTSESAFKDSKTTNGSGIKENNTPSRAPTEDNNNQPMKVNIAQAEYTIRSGIQRVLSNGKHSISSQIQNSLKGITDDPVMQESTCLPEMILVKAGDVESNPGPFDRSANIQEQELVNLAYDVPSSKYTQLCIALGVSYNQSQTILDKRHWDFTESLIQIFCQWKNKQRDGTNCRNGIAAALRVVNLDALGDKLSGAESTIKDSNTPTKSTTEENDTSTESTLKGTSSTTYIKDNGSPTESTYESNNHSSESSITGNNSRSESTPKDSNTTSISAIKEKNTPSRTPTGERNNQPMKVNSVQAEYTTGSGTQKVPSDGKHSILSQIPSSLKRTTDDPVMQESTCLPEMILVKAGDVEQNPGPFDRNEQGTIKKIPLDYNELLKTKVNGELPKRFMVEGEGGAGKTTLCTKMAWDWTNGADDFQEHILVDVTFEAYEEDAAKLVGQHLFAEQKSLEINDKMSAHTVCGYLFIMDKISVETLILSRSCGPAESLDLADVICSSTSLTALELSGTALDNDFYSILESKVKTSKIEKLCIDCNLKKNDPTASRALAKFLCLLPFLTDLRMKDSHNLWLHDDFYHELAVFASSSKIQKVLMEGRCLEYNDGMASRNLARFLCVLPCLTDLTITDSQESPSWLSEDFYQEIALRGPSSMNNFFNKKLHMDESSEKLRQMDLRQQSEYIGHLLHPTSSEKTPCPTSRAPEPLSSHQGSVEEQIEHPLVTPSDLDVPSSSGINQRKHPVQLVEPLNLCRRIKGPWKNK